MVKEFGGRHCTQSDVKLEWCEILLFEKHLSPKQNNNKNWLPQSHTTSNILVSSLLNQNVPPTMPPANSNMAAADTGLTCMTTQSKNATTHPGTMAQDALCVYWKKEDIAIEKKLKNAKKEANRKKRKADEAQQAAGEEYIAQLKAREATAIENEIPCHRPGSKS